jgi:hypothetical protein
MAGRAEVIRRSRHVEGWGVRRLGLGRLLLLSFCCFLAAAAPASAATGHVDGISDQSMPRWDGNFSGGSVSNYWMRSAAADCVAPRQRRAGGAR